MSEGNNVSELIKNIRSKDLTTEDVLIDYHDADG